MGTMSQPHNATLNPFSSDSDNVITSGVVTLTATFSENMAATPLISIAGLVTNTAMTQGSSAAEWTYYWQVPSSSHNWNLCSNGSSYRHNSSYL